MQPRPPRSTINDTIFPYTTLFRSLRQSVLRVRDIGVRMKPLLDFGDMTDRRHEAVGVERNRVDALVHQKSRKLGIVARRLTADADLDPNMMGLDDCLVDQAGNRLAALIEQRRQVAGITVDPERQLGQIVAAAREAVEAGSEMLGENGVGGNLAQHNEMKKDVAGRRG